MITDEIIKTALLGTEKYMPQPNVSLEEITNKIAAQSTEKEDRFLKQAAVTLLYKEAGSLAHEVIQAPDVCPDEVLALVPELYHQLIKTALSSKDDVLFQFLIYNCNQKNRVLQPQLVPLVLNKALEQKKNAQQLLKACGETGKWLCNLNKEWQVFYNATSEENVWETGNFENRKQYFVALRQSNPAEAILLLENSIQAENAANRQAFIELLHTGLSIHDEAFLMTQLNDKSQKVKDAALALLRIIQGSQINQSYLQQVLKTLSIKEQRHLLITKKKILVIDEHITPDESLLKTGIQKVSSEKGVKDSIFILGQLLACIDPNILAQHLNVTDADLITLLLQHEAHKALLPFLNSAASAFKNRAWALSLLSLSDNNNITLLDALDKKEQKEYYEGFIEKNLHALMDYVLNNNYNIIDLPFAGKLLEHLRINSYVITQPLYQRLALHLPETILPKLNEYSLDTNDHYQAKYFRSQAFEMIRILEIKKQIQ
jgi:hypothetical protein